MTTFRVFCIFSFLILIVPFTAQAEPVDQDGAVRLKAMFEELVEYQKTITGIENGRTLQADGEVAVEPLDKYYAITLPHLKMSYPDGDNLEIGIISLNAAPYEKPNQWKMTLALPTPMVLFDAEGEQTMRTHIGSQQAAGIWHELLQHFYKLDATYGDITVEGAEPEFTLTLPSANIRYDLSEDENKHLSGPGVITLNNLEVDTPDTDISVGETKVTLSIDQYDPTFIKEYREKIISLAQNTDPDKMNDENVIALYNALLETLLKSSNGFTSNYSISDFRLSDEEGVPLSIGAAQVGLDMNGFFENDVDIATRIQLSGFNPQPDPTYEGLAPSDINIDLRINNVPFKQITDLAQNTMQGAISQPEMAQLAGLSFMMKLPAIMAQSGTHIEIKDNYIAGKDYKVTLNGTARADMSALNSATVDATAVFYGLDTLLARVQTALADPANEEVERFKRMEKELLTLQKLGRIETAVDGQNIYHYKFVMDEKGQILLNDQDIFSLLQQ